MSVQVIIVDGSGPGGDRDYARTMAGSFCSQIRDHFGRAADYNRGPSDLGMECADQSEWAFNMCQAARRLHKKIFMAGYSRGGAVVITAAYRFGHEIDSLFLFDAVDRSAVIDGYTSNCNVNNVFHVRRDQSIKDPWFSAQSYSRRWFGN